MVLNRIMKAFEKNDEKYEVLHHRYSSAMAQIAKMKREQEMKSTQFKTRLREKFALEIIKLYECVESARISGYKITETNKDIQRTLLEINKAEKAFKEALKKFSIEEVEAKQRFYDSQLHSVASYEKVSGMKEGIILKTVRKGFKYRNSLIKKPKVIVTQ